MIKTTPRGGAAAWLVAVSSAGFGLAAAASVTAVLPIRFPHGEGAAGFSAYYYREGVELAGFLLVALLVPIAIVVGLQVWARLADSLSDRFPCLSSGETAAQAAAPFVGLLAVVPSLPLLASERSLDLGSAAAVALVLFGSGWLFVTRRPASGIAVALAVGGAAGAAVSSLLTRPSPLAAWTAALIGALLAAWAARRRAEAGVWLLPIALVPLICGMGLSLMDGVVVVGRQGLGAWRWDPNGVRAIDPTLGRFEIAAAGTVFALPLASELKRPVAVALDMTLGVSTSGPFEPRDCHNHARMLFPTTPSRACRSIATGRGW